MDKHETPWWVRWLTQGGRPVVLVVALLMCAPGEYHLARLAGWADPFAYGMPFALSAYAGIAAAVATTRPKDTPGHGSAVYGAVAALALAIAAQVTSHLLSGGYLEKTPALVAVVSLVPPAVVGHLLHLAASPARKETVESTPVLSTVEPVEETVEPVEETVEPVEETVDQETSADETPDADRVSSGDTREQIIGLWSEGRSAQETVDKIGCSKSYVYKVYKELRQGVA